MSLIIIRHISEAGRGEVRCGCASRDTVDGHDLLGKVELHGVSNPKVAIQLLCYGHWLPHSFYHRELVAHAYFCFVRRAIAASQGSLPFMRDAVVLNVLNSPVK